MNSAAQLPARTKRIVVIGTLLGLLLAGSNQTIVSTALPSIVADLGGLNLLSWVFTGYMLTSTTIVPISGKLSDLYGRKPFFMMGIVIFMLASIAGGLVGSLEQLILVRALQGLGGGMLMSSVFAIIGDLFEPEERGKYQGIYISMFGVASILGPTLGGTMTDALSWRGIFYINLPFGVAALALVGSSFPSLERQARKVDIDYLGVAFLTSTLVCLLLALAWGGNVHPWGSLEIVGLLVASGVLLAGFLYVESRASEPIVPLHLFKNRVFAAGSLLTFFSGISLMGVLTFMPMFLQGVLGASATSSGLVLSPMMIAVVFSSNIAGYLVTKTGRYRSLIVVGSAIMLGGMVMLASFTTETTWLEAILGMALVGIGVGLAIPIVSVAIQNAFSRRYLGVVTSSSQFFRQIGGTLGVAVFGTLVVSSIESNLNRNLPVEVKERASPALIDKLGEPDVILSTQGRSDVESGFLALGADGAELFDAALQAVETSLTGAVTDVFLVGLIVAVVSLVFSFLMPERLTAAAEEAPAIQPEPVHGADAAQRSPVVRADHQRMESG